MTESSRIEYKQAVTDSLEKEVVAFLNAHEGGTIYLGVNDKGETVGIQNADQVQLALKDRLKNNIRPSCFGLFEIVLEHADGKDILRINIASGSEKPYYIKHFGMAEKGCFIRVGSAAEPMPTAMIERLFSQRIRNTIGMMRSPRGDLTFKLLKLYYQEGGYELNPSFLTNLELKTPEGDLNYAAYLLADENGVSIKVAKYAGTTRVDLAENSEYGYCSLIKAVSRVLEKLEIENRTFAKITPRKRLERRMIDPTALREAVINAVIHNDYSNGAPPKVELFSDRVEITSMGGLPYGITQEDFFAGISAPRNKELMRVFRDLELVEHLGSGVPRILKAYDTDAFEIRENYVRVTFPYREGFTDTDGSDKSSDKSSDKILEMMKENPKISAKSMAETLQITPRAVEKQIAELKKLGLVIRIGERKGGHWEVLDHA
ncbi:MAG: putative DNA binding domain-containing protein [Candidatus Thiothrix singaporensis]|uniref:DNA binding domain-containing protein n=1 Tax=Candidatus Thiothrix singaporensis TaxID=2799669 RepID=A0A7L6AXZ4_9GAMM|nr:MAG: putative DNA binding domain-containing protein [Candidatus Thiothrix singaporensis]